MKLQHLKYFVAVFEEGSFSAGAQRVNATQSGLSMHVRQLEDRYQVKLLNRSSSGVTPTEVGKRFYQDAVRVLHAATEADANLKSMSGTVTGHVTVGLMPTMAFIELGMTTDPSVSVPTAAAHRPSATPTPDPELEPPGVRD